MKTNKSQAYADPNSTRGEYHSTQRSTLERIFHAFLFEIVALIICAPLFAFLLGRSVSEMGLITLIIATVAVVWNYIYNLLFDRVTAAVTERTLSIRIIHAIIFEIGLIVITVPLIAWIFLMTMKEAFYMEIGILLFFLPYTVVYNWIYDAVRKQLWLKKQRH